MHRYQERNITEDLPMQTIQTSYRGLSLLMDLNWDRALYVTAIFLALLAGAFVGTL